MHGGAKDTPAGGGTRTGMSASRWVVSLSLILLFVLAAPPARAGDDDAVRKAEQLLARADARVTSLRDFEATIRARTRLSLLPAVELTGHAYFKRPNHVKVDFDNLPAMLARVRRQMQAEPPYGNRKAYVPRWLRLEDCDGKPCDVIIFKSRDASRRLQAMTIWLDQGSSIFPKCVLDYADGAQCLVTTRYGKIGAYLLPLTSEVELHVSPATVRSSVTYSDHMVNRGIPDAVFEKF